LDPTRIPILVAVKSDAIPVRDAGAAVSVVIVVVVVVAFADTAADFGKSPFEAEACKIRTGPGVGRASSRKRRTGSERGREQTLRW
jgi:hypothetical protein